MRKLGIVLAVSAVAALSALAVGLSSCAKRPYLDGHYATRDRADHNIKLLENFCDKPDSDGYRNCAAIVYVSDSGGTYKRYVVGMWNSGTLIVSYQGHTHEMAPGGDINRGLVMSSNVDHPVFAKQTAAACPAGPLAGHYFSCSIGETDS